MISLVSTRSYLEVLRRKIKETVNFSVLQHNLDEFIVVQLSIPVLVSLIPKFFKFFVSQSLAQSGSDGSQLFGLNKSIFVLVKNLKGFLQSLHSPVV